MDESNPRTGSGEETARGGRPRLVVVGGGHAGAEAAAVAARLGVSVKMVTLHREAVGRMSCNPSIGGLAKGQIVREIDALGGLMARVADRSALHFRLLNASRGPAVQSPRTQNDRALYEAYVQRDLAEAGVEVVEGEVLDLIVEEGRVAGVLVRPTSEARTSAAEGAASVPEGVRRLPAEAVVLTTGTFLGGVLHVGEESFEGGRLGESAAHQLAERLATLGFRTGRLKTGTPPRLHKDSIDWSRTTPQPSDEPPVRFSFEAHPLQERRLDCALTSTTPTGHAIIERALDRSPLFSGRIRGQGPRYCPSIEDKIFRFPDREGHQIFLEPEGFDSDLVYPNGISTSLPRDVQEALVHSIPALERAEITAFGYAVEYVHVDPTECRPTLETKRLPGLYLAGQICGTTGYEEAAGLGLWAGVNAAHALMGRAPFRLLRHESYLGVLVDDLTTRGVSEPYRMFTSLAEHRLLLRHHDADLRLFEHAERLGARHAAALASTRERRQRRLEARARLEKARMGRHSAWEAMRRPEFSWEAALDRLEGLASLRLDERDRHELLLDARYEGYVAREREMIERRREAEETELPDDLDYARLSALSHEAREKLERLRPATIGQASRITGIRPADVSILLVALSRRRRGGRGGSEDQAS